MERAKTTFDELYEVAMSCRDLRDAPAGDGDASGAAESSSARSKAPVEAAPAPQVAGPLPGGVVPLWTVDDLCAFLGRKRRWAEYAVKTPETEVGSIPHIRIGRSPRFDPETIREWSLAGFPPAATFRAWKESGGRRRQRA
jgi:hypothetical protein